MRKDLEYSTVEFSLYNPTISPVNAGLFDVNSTIEVPVSDNPIAYPDTNTNQILLGATYDGIAYDSKRKNIITGDSNGNIKVVNVSTLQVVSSSQATVSPRKMIYIESVDRIYAIGRMGAGNNKYISEINPATGAEVGVFIAPSSPSFTDIAFSPVNNKIYARSNSGIATLFVFSIITNTYLPPVNSASFFSANFMTYSESNNSIYTFGFLGNNISKLDCNTDTIVANITTGVNQAYNGVFNSVNNQIYYQDNNASIIRILDIATDTVIAPTILGLTGNINSLAYSPVTNTIWGMGNTGANVYVINANGNFLESNIIKPVSWTGQIIYAANINMVYTTPDNALGGGYIQQISPSASQFFIEGSSSYNLFVNDNLVNPKKLDRIIIYAEDISNLSNPMEFLVTEATGDSCSFPILPNTTVVTDQFQGQIGLIDVDDYILDATTKIDYIIPPLTKISLVIYYKQYTRSDLLAGKVMIKEFDVLKSEDPNTYTDDYIEETRLRPIIEINNILNVNNI